ncbi:MAG: c-type cytochrome [Paracoccaceae bacterium]|nr:c-type cytochrome [Paracoccaceae bacterium]MDG2259481.1 c-type cytochrome [Paracoccaceae bacterium]
MTTGNVVKFGLLASAIAAAFLLQTGQVVFGADAPGQASAIAAGEQLYAENCASCHGANLEGQPDWRTKGPDGKLPAPPHDNSGHTWHHSDSVLFNYTKLGGAELMKQQGIDFDSGMPGFGDILTDDEINNILSFIKSTWPEREKRVQAERTNAEKQ